MKPGRLYRLVRIRRSLAGPRTRRIASKVELGVLTHRYDQVPGKPARKESAQPWS
jgi:hypothetical protein